MNEENKDLLWHEVDNYLESQCIQEPDCITAAYKASGAANLPEIAVSPLQGQFLAQLIAISASKNILELGTLGGYSALWMAQSLPSDGQIVTLEHNPVCAGVARANFAHAGYDQQITLRYGEAMDSLKALIGEKGEPFDFVFLDANKAEYPEYLRWILKLTKKGSIIIADNIVRDGDVVQKDGDDHRIHGIREFIKAVSDNPKLQASALQTVGTKGYDGFMLIRRIG